MISAIIITYNEESNIEECLKSISWVDEIVIVDSGSTDNTEQICKKYTKSFYFQEWFGYGPQKQFALGLAKNQWILSIDADERVTPELRNDLENILKNEDTISGYFIPRENYYLGKKIKYCGWYPDYTLRFAKRDKASFDNNLVHEKLLVDGSTAKLFTNMTHYPFKSIAQQLLKLNKYSTISADGMFNQNKSIPWIILFMKPIFTFFKIFILRFGFLDGWRGLIISLAASSSTYYKYLKLKERHLSKKERKN